MPVAYRIYIGFKETLESFVYKRHISSSMG